jgi:chromosome segregation ATPase
MTAPHAVLSAEELAAYDAGYRLGKAAGLAEGALRRETPDGAPNDTLDALTAHAQRTGEYDPPPLEAAPSFAEWFSEREQMRAERDGAQNECERLRAERDEAIQYRDRHLDARVEAEAERDRLTARVAELETAVGDAIALFDRSLTEQTPARRDLIIAACERLDSARASAPAGPTEGA